MSTRNARKREIKASRGKREKRPCYMCLVLYNPALVLLVVVILAVAYAYAFARLGLYAPINDIRLQLFIKATTALDVV